MQLTYGCERLTKKKCDRAVSSHHQMFISARAIHILKMDSITSKLDSSFSLDKPDMASIDTRRPFQVLDSEYHPRSPSEEQKRPAAKNKDMTLTVLGCGKTPPDSLLRLQTLTRSSKAPWALPSSPAYCLPSTNTAHPSRYLLPRPLPLSECRIAS